MRPRFRSDLKCSREEQQGVVFYRVDDPKTQTSFRLYEIEYLIAQKLDGARALADVIKIVKDEYNFDISEPDLHKFVSQLDSMGFIEKEGAAADPAGEVVTKVMDRGDVQVERATELVEADLLEAPSGNVDEAELKRILKSALMHVRQGYIVHARDYFLAAKELSPGDARLAKLVSHLEIIGDASGPAEVDYLWNQAQELFPDIAAEVAPLADSKATASAATSAELGGGRWRGEDNLRRRVFWLALLVLIVVGGGGALFYFARVTGVFAGAAQVTVATLRSQRLPVYHDKVAVTARPAREAWLQLAAGGRVGQVAVAAGTRVQPDQVLVTLELPAALEKQVAAARAAAKKAEGEHDKAASKLEKLLKDREGVEAERRAVDQKLEELKSKNLATQGAAAKRELEKWKKAKVKVNKKLSQAAKRERAPRGQEQKTGRKLEQARRKLAALEAQGGNKQIRAPFAGLVVEVAARKGQAVAKGFKAVLVRDNLEVRLGFVVAEAGGLAVGGEAFVSVARGAPSRAKVAAVQVVDGGKQIEVMLVDPTGSFVELKPEEFRLAREFVEPAFEVPISAVMSDAQGTRVFIELQGRALAREVQVLSRDAANAIIQDKSGTVRDGERVVVDRIGGDGGVASIADGSFLEVQN